MNKKTSFIIGISICILVTALLVKGMLTKTEKEVGVLLLPSLPKPIALEYALITSAGQSTDAYIINDMTNRLLIHNYFMPQAEQADLQGVKSIIFVPGYSAIGVKLHDTTFSKEKERVRNLLAKAKKNKLVVITVYVGGKQRRDQETNELLEILCKQSDYLIATEDADYDGFLTGLAKARHLPVTLASGVQDIEEPYASVFR